MSALPLSTKLAECRAADAAARRAVADHVLRVAGLRCEAERLESEAARADSVQLEEAAADIADGAPAPNLATSPGEALRRRAMATQRAAERVAHDLPALEAGAARTRAALVDVALTAERVLRGNGLAALREAQMGLAPALAMLSASTKVRHDLIGDRFVFDPATIHLRNFGLVSAWQRSSCRPFQWRCHPKASRTLSGLRRPGSLAQHLAGTNMQNEVLESLKVHVEGTAPLARVEGEGADGRLQVRRKVVWREYRELFEASPDEAALLVTRGYARRVKLTGQLADLARVVLTAPSACKAVIAAIQAGFRVWHAVPVKGSWQPAPGGGVNGPLAVGFRDELAASQHWEAFPASVPLFIVPQASGTKRTFIRGEAGGLVPLPSSIIRVKG